MNVIDAHRKRVGLNVKAARLAAGLTLDRLAALIGTSRQHLIRVEKGGHLPRQPLLEAIARETSTTVAHLESDPSQEVARSGDRFRDGGGDVRGSAGTDQPGSRGARGRESAGRSEGPPVKDAA